MASQEHLGLVDKIKERKAKPIIANSQANIGDKANKWKYNPNHLLTAINQKTTDDCCTI